MNDGGLKIHGRTWRLVAHETGGDFEVADRGTFDELVVDQWFHIERMDANTFWLRVGDARLTVTLDGDAAVVDVIRGFHSVVAGTTTEHVPPK